jgi:hypothetical protein
MGKKSNLGNVAIHPYSMSVIIHALQTQLTATEKMNILELNKCYPSDIMLEVYTVNIEHLSETLEIIKKIQKGDIALITRDFITQISKN